MTFAACVQRFDDHLNPILVKEMRQAVTSRTISSTLNTFLVLCLLVFGFYLFRSGIDPQGAAAGRGAFMMLQGLLVIFGVIGLPAQVAQRFNAERSVKHLDMLYVTPMTAESIFMGKVKSAMLLVVMVYSACAPFAALTYLLRGIDLPVILVTIVSNLFFALLSTLYAIALATFARGAIGRFVCGVFGAVGMLFFGGLAMAMSGLLVREGSSVLMRGGFWGLVTVGTFFITLVVLIVVACALDCIRPYPSTRELRRASSSRTRPLGELYPPQGVT